MGPYSLTAIGNQTGTVQASDTFASWLIQPYQINSSGSLPGTTTVSVNNAQGTGAEISGPQQSINLGNIQLSGPTGSITVSDSTNGQTVISILGQLGYILFTNPSTTINQMVEGTLPDGTTGLVASVSGVDVLSIFT